MVVSHQRRMALIKQINALHPEDAILLEAPTVDERQMNKPQDLWIYSGIEMIASCAKKTNGVYNGCLYTVLEIGEKITLQSNSGEVTLSRDQVARDLRCAAAFTYHATQGKSLTGTVKCWDLDHPRMTLQHLYVGLSRGTSHALVSVD